MSLQRNSKVMLLIKKLKSYRFKIALNLMQSSDRSENEIKNFCQLSKKKII